MSKTEVVRLGEYGFVLNEKMRKLIQEGLVQIVVYEDDGYVPPRPFVEIQTDLEKTNVDFCEFVQKFDNIEEANKCTEVIGNYLNIPFKKAN